MLKQLIFLFLSIVFAGFSYAGADFNYRYVDSIFDNYLLYHQQSSSDFPEINTNYTAKELNTLAQRNNYTFPQYSIQISELALEKANIVSNRTEIARAYLNLFIACFRNGEYSRAFDCLHKAENEIEFLQEEEKGNLYLHKGHLFLFIFNDKNTRTYFEEAELYFSSTNNYTGLAKVYIGYGDLLEPERGDTGKINQYNIALKYAKKSKDIHAIGWANDAIGNLYLGQNDYEKALPYFKVAAVNDMLAGINEGEGLSKLAYTCLLLGDINRAEKYTDGVIFVASKLDITKRLAYAYWLKSEIEIQKGKPVQALKYLKTHYAFQSKMDDAEMVMAAYQNFTQEQNLYRLKMINRQMMLYGIIFILLVIVFGVILIYRARVLRHKILANEAQLRVKRMGHKIEKLELQKLKIGNLLVESKARELELTQLQEQSSKEKENYLKALQDEKEKQEKLLKELSAKSIELTNTSLYENLRKSISSNDQDKTEELSIKLAGILSKQLQKQYDNFKLSDKELKIILYMRCGYQAKEISEHLFVTPKTVYDYNHRIKKKLKISNEEFDELVNIWE